MARNRRARPELTESWGTVDDGDGYEPDIGQISDEDMPHLTRNTRSRGRLSEDDEDYDQHTPLRDVTSGMRKSTRLSRQNTPTLESSKSSPKLSNRRRSKNSAEPQLIMPSIESLPRRRSSRSQDITRSRQLSQPLPPPQASHSSPLDRQTWFSPESVWKDWIQPFLEALFAILQMVLNFLKPVAIWLLALWAFIFISFYTANHLFSKFSTSLSPLCNIWGVSQLGLPFCMPQFPSNATGPVEFEELVNVQSAFEDIISSAASGSTLPTDMKRSESSIRDLKHVVRFSNLPSRNELVFEFEGFTETARQASSDLIRFNSRIGRSVDHIININKWTLRFLDDMDTSQSGGISRLSSALLPIFGYTQVATERNLLERYLGHTSAVEEQIAGLIQEAQALLTILQNLDDRLDVIAGIVERDGVNLKGSRDELFALLWTKLGGNRSSVKKLNSEIRLLKEVSIYRKTAWAHVSGTLLKLQTIGAQLEDLRERVAAPEVVGVQIGGKGQIPLRMHIENIQSGVDRLETSRGEQRRIEGENYRKVLDRAGMSDDRLGEGS